MADSAIGGLPTAPQFDDDSLLVTEQQGQARKLTGRQLKKFAQSSVTPYIEIAQKWAQEASEQADRAADEADRAANEVQNAAKEVDRAAAEADRSAGEADRAADEAKKAESSAQDASESAAQAKESADKAADSAEAAETAVEHYPKIGESGNWEIYRDGAYQDTGKPARGETGKGFRVLGYYETVGDLEVDVVDPEDGDAYGVGTEAPYEIYIYDDKLGWVNNGTIQGAEGPQGEPGKSGVHIGTDEPTDPETNVWIDPSGTTTSCSYEQMQQYVDNAIDALTAEIIRGFEE